MPNNFSISLSVNLETARIHPAFEDVALQMKVQ
jgi:hypothetical protein